MGESKRVITPHTKHTPPKKIASGKNSVAPTKTSGIITIDTICQTSTMHANKSVQ